MTTDIDVMILEQNNEKMKTHYDREVFKSFDIPPYNQVLDRMDREIIKCLEEIIPKFVKVNRNLTFGELYGEPGIMRKYDEYSEIRIIKLNIAYACICSKDPVRVFRDHTGLPIWLIQQMLLFGVNGALSLIKEHYDDIPTRSHD